MKRNNRTKMKPNTQRNQKYLRPDKVTSQRNNIEGKTYETHNEEVTQPSKTSSETEINSETENETKDQEMVIEIERIFNTNKILFE